MMPLQSLTSATQTELSQHEIFYVVNSAPSAMPLSVSSHRGRKRQDRRRDAAGFGSHRVQSRHELGSGSVHARSRSTSLKTAKTCTRRPPNIVVQQGMTLGWRTGSVPNGTYDVYFTGAISPEGGKAYTRGERSPDGDGAELG